MLNAIKAYEIEGVETTLPFGTYVCEHEAFRSGNFDTHFVKQHYAPEQLMEEQKAEARIAALVAIRKYREEEKQLRIPKGS